MPRVLIVEDDPAVRDVVEHALTREGMDVKTFGDAETTLEHLRGAEPFDLVILDVMLPGMDGISLCRELRAGSADPTLTEVPVIMLTARDDETSVVVGLEVGADDYVTKPFSPRELVARVRAVLRRTEGNQTPATVLRFGDLVVDLDRRNVTLRGQPVELTPTEFELLQILAREPGRPFTRAQLLERAYDVAYAGYDRTVDAHIKNLRRKLEPDPRGPRYIITLYGVGYKFAEQ